MGGGVSAADWQACRAAAGWGTIQTDTNTFTQISEKHKHCEAGRNCVLRERAREDVPPCRRAASCVNQLLFLNLFFVLYLAVWSLFFVSGCGFSSCVGGFVHLCLVLMSFSQTVFESSLLLSDCVPAGGLVLSLSQ